MHEATRAEQSGEYGSVKNVIQQHARRSFALSRRALLRLLGVASGGLLLGSACSEEDDPDSEHSAGRREPSPLARELRHHFSYLSIEPDVLEAFVRDFERHRGPWQARSEATPNARFLASTDFFQNGADETRPLRYVTYYDPYVSPCYNPFANPFASPFAG